MHLIKFFDRHAKIIRDYTWLETHLAKLVPMELVVRVRPELLRSTKPAGEAGGSGRIRPRPTPSAASGCSWTSWNGWRSPRGFRRPWRGSWASRGRESSARPCPCRPSPRIAAAGLSDVARSGPLGDEPQAGRASRRVSGQRLPADRSRARPKAGGEGREGSREPNPNKGSELWRISLRVGALRDIDYGAVRRRTETGRRAGADGVSVPRAGVDRVGRPQRRQGLRQVASGISGAERSGGGSAKAAEADSSSEPRRRPRSGAARRRGSAANWIASTRDHGKSTRRRSSPRRSRT